MASPKVIGMANRAHRIDLTAHIQGASQEFANVRSTAAPVLWGGGVVDQRWVSPQGHHVLFGDSRLGSGVIHHELLNSQGPERIKDQQLLRLGLIMQPVAQCKTFHHALAQLKRITPAE